MTSFPHRPILEDEVSHHPGQPSAHRRKYGMSIRFRGRAHEDVNNSWYYACKEADINFRRPGAYGPAKEDMGARYARFRRDSPPEASRWAVCEALGIPRALLRRRPINRQLHRQKLGGSDPAVVRGRCAQYGTRCVPPLGSSSSLLMTLLQCLGDDEARLCGAAMDARRHVPARYRAGTVE